MSGELDEEGVTIPRDDLHHDRPSSVTVFGWLATVLGGIFCFLMLRVLVLAGLPSDTSLAYWLTRASLGLSALLWLVSGVGLLRGTRWGWWALGLMGVFGIVRHLVGVIYVLFRVGLGPLPWLPITIAFVKGFFFVAVLWFWNTRDVRRWCGTLEISRRTRFTVITVTGVLLVAVFLVLSQAARGG